MKILDTNIVIYLQKGLLNQKLPEDNYAISIITEIELLSFSGLLPTQEKWLQRFIASVTVFPLDQTIKDSTIKLRKTHKLKIPDAIIVATALIHKSCLLTADKQLLTLPKLKVETVELCK